MDRRRVAVALCLVAFVGAIAFAYAGYRCGMRRSGETCTSAEECLAESECVSYVHPMAIPFAALAAVGAALAWMRLAIPAIVMGIVGIGVGLLFGFSMGFVGMGIGALVLAAGLLVLHDRSSAARAEP